MTSLELTTRPELLEASDETIDDAMAFADPMVLRGLVYQLTGDESVAAVEVTSAVFGFLEVQTLANPSDAELVRAKAAAFLKSYRDEGAGPISAGPAERLHRSVSLTTGVDIPRPELEMWLEQLALDPWARGLIWNEPPSSHQQAPFSVAVIGAGLGGINAAVQLKRAGVPIVVFEKNAGVGGTWYENRYPGARVDTPSRSYTHIYGVDFEYPSPFCEQRENEKYFNWVTDTFGIREDIAFNTEVESVIWDDDAKLWEIRAVGPEGDRVSWVNAVISSVGFLSRPNIPTIDGTDEFKGLAFHTARWPEDLDLEGKRIAVIGTGCTGYQMVPELARVAAHTYVFQREANWCFPYAGYLDPFPPQVNWLDRNLPYHTNFMRLRTSWVFGPQSIGPVFEVDPDFKDPHATSALNKRIREQGLAFLQEKFADRPDLFEKMLPEAPPMSARPVLVDADYSIYDVLLRDNVTLVTDGIQRITPSGLEAAGGDKYPVDVIVYATGFKASDYLWPMDIRGRGGQRLDELWAKDGARAYIGTMLPGFPNFFMVYGPNTNPQGGLNVVDLEEIVTRFALECIRGLIEQQRSAVDVTLDAYWRYNNELDRLEATKTYKDPRSQNYYQNEHGRSAVNCPIDGRQMWNWLRSPISRPADDAQQIKDGPASARPDVISPYFGEDLILE
jgi:4-hydroxyacetophenone monooxygenase